MPPDKTATLLQQPQDNRAIAKLLDLQHRPFPRPGERISNIWKCQGRQGLAGCL